MSNAAGRSRELRRAGRRQQQVRRRRLGALGAVAALAAIAGAIAGSGGEDGRRPGGAAPIPPQCSGSGPKAARRMAGQRIVVRTDASPDSKLLRRARAGEIAGVIVFPDTGEDAEAVRAGVKRLQAAAAEGGQPSLVVSTDQEGGAVKRFLEAPPQRSPAQLALDGDGGDAQLEGKATGTFLAGLGINVDLAPVLDVPTSTESVVHSRAFGSTPERVANLGLRFAAGLEKGGVRATAKHFPGLGRSTINTDLGPSQIDASRRDLRQDLAPFEEAIAQGIPLIMVGTASYPELGAKAPAALDPAIVQGLLRDRLGFQGVAISDDLQAGAIDASYTSAEAAIAGAAAGMDLLLFAGDAAPGVLGPLAAAISGGKVEIEAARAACTRVVALRERLGPPAG
ncbi:MAG: glycoside hydrolase family 3 N-terminal domain-containing protein [bacterium]